MFKIKTITLTQAILSFSFSTDSITPTEHLKLVSSKNIQWFGFYHQKVHVLSEMNKTIACTVAKAQEELGYSPEYSLGKGIEISLEEVYN